MSWELSLPSCKALSSLGGKLSPSRQRKLGAIDLSLGHPLKRRATLWEGCLLWRVCPREHWEHQNEGTDPLLRYPLSLPVPSLNQEYGRSKATGPVCLTAGDLSAPLGTGRVFLLTS